MLLLADAGMTEYVITVAAEASAPERHAAQELSRYLGEIAGARFEIVAPDAKGNRPCLAVGAGAATAAGLDPEELEDLGDDGLLIRTQDPDIVLSGGAGAPRGTLYAVYTFLEDTLGCRWWTHEASYIPSMPRLEIPDLNRRFVPILEYREPFHFHAFDGDWAVRNKSNGNSERLDAQRGGKHVYKGFVHTFFPLVPPEKHFAEHPEWYSEIEGKRVHERAQLCLTNPELLEFLTERVREWLRESPEATIISVSQNDWHGACTCDNCRAIDEEEGSHAGTLLRFVNAVAERIEDEFPNVAVDTLAYQYTRKPPKVTKPRHNVIVRLCSIECNFAQPLSHESNRAFREDIEGWYAICDRLYIWDYVTDFRHYVQPHPNWYVLGENVRFFVEHGVKGLFEQGSYQSLGGEMAELRAWVLAKMLWDPSRNASALIDEFLTGFYGHAAPHIVDYMHSVHDAVIAANYHLGCFTPHDAPFLSPDLILEALRHFSAAKSAVRNDRERLAHVELASLAPMYLALMRWDEVRERADATGQEWVLADKRLAAVEDFAVIYDANRMTHLAEWGERNIDWLRRECAK
ncbi:DUF4838 domain-containing protein [Candidatus Poribacteria bacterium]|nr:DUF4838 domain-containing protein [Candidatus Poribacteria bacterium]